jgi:hypothetical protein
MKLSTMFILSSVVLASACGSKDSQKTETTNAVEVQAHNENTVVSNGVTFISERAVEVREDFSNLEEVRDNLNTFKVTATFENPTAEKSSLKCSKIIDSKDIVSSTRIEKGSQAGTLEIKLGERELKTDINCQILNSKGEVATAHFSFLKSLFVNGPTSINLLAIAKSDDVLLLDRVIITSQGSLVTEGQSIKMSAKAIYSDHGKIETFTKSENDENTMGKSGGELVIKTENSYGDLSIYLRGINGGDQTETPPKKEFPGLIVDSSRDAIATVTSIDCPESSGNRSHGHEHCRTQIDIAGKAAVAGSDGLKGDKAYPGNAGGDSGRVDYQTNDNSEDFNIHFFTKAGVGGKPGLPGEGSEGSKGGRAAGNFPAGRDGVKGAMGDSAEKGADGKNEISCWTNILKDKTTCN